ncbi:MAG: hypothetical protein QOI01_7172 [Mycobacterium sp.]|nr:hypothetical protein [Mycobacterium sp.]
MYMGGDAFKDFVGGLPKHRLPVRCAKTKRNRGRSRTPVRWF